MILNGRHWLKKGVRLYEADHFVGWRCPRCGEVYSTLDELGNAEAVHCGRCRDNTTLPVITFSKERLVYSDAKKDFVPMEKK